MQISDLSGWVRGLDEPSVAPLLAALQQTLDSFVEIGLGYLSLDRPSGTLSGGEAQRTKMIRHLGSSLTDVTYVFDEPTIGLHPHDIERMNTCCCSCATRATPCWSWSTSRRRSRSPTTSSTSARAPAPRAARSCSRAPSRDCGPATRSPATISTTAPPSRRPCARRRACWRCAAPPPTTCGTSTSTSRSACWSSSPAWPARARARSSTARCPDGTAWSRSTRARSAVRDAATRRRTPACSTRSARRSRRPTA